MCRKSPASAPACSAAPRACTHPFGWVPGTGPPCSAPAWRVPARRQRSSAPPVCPRQTTATEAGGPAGPVPWSRPGAQHMRENFGHVRLAGPARQCPGADARRRIDAPARGARSCRPILPSRLPALLGHPSRAPCRPQPVSSSGWFLRGQQHILLPVPTCGATGDPPGTRTAVRDLFVFLGRCPRV